jgi:hypothetical protein
MIPNKDHPLNRRNTYNPKDPDEICIQALQRAYNRAYIQKMDKDWGEGWRDCHESLGK